MSFTWQDIRRLVKRWWWLAVLAVTVASISSYRASQSATPLYYTKATLMIGRAMQDPNPNQADLWIGQELAVTYAQMAQRQPVLQAAIDSLGLQVDWGALAGRVNASIVARTQLLEIHVVDSNPQRAKALADAIAEQLVLLSPANPSGISQDDQAFARQQLDDLKVKIEDAKEESKQLKEELDAAISARQIQDLQSQVQVLELKISGWQSTYSQLLVSLQGGEANVLTFLEEASVPTNPISPRVKTNVLLAAAIGLALATGAVALMEFADDTLRIDDPNTESVLGLPLLGTVPSIADGRCEPRSSEAEVIRQLRTNVLLASPNGHWTSLLVSSPQPKEGKTVLTANLGVAMAGGGARVMLVDADMRSPALHEWFDQPNLAGLADLLAADRSQYEHLLPQLMRNTHVPGLSFISAGHLPLDPSILLASSNMAALLELLSEQFDLVIFDSPPMLAAPDATILAMLAEGTLLVFSPDRTSRRAVRQLRDSLKSRSDVHVAGVVLNRVSLGRYAYPYSYRQERALQQEYKIGLVRRLANALSVLPLIGQPPDPDLISLSRAATILGVRQDTVKRWCQEGRLPAVKQGLRWWVRQDELQSTALDRLMVGRSSDTQVHNSSDGRSTPESLWHPLGMPINGNPGSEHGEEPSDETA
jgi:succinoglycan biosynthesis transport protein ExoP